MARMKSPLQAAITASALIVCAGLVLKVGLAQLDAHEGRPTESCLLTFDQGQRLEVPVARTLAQMQQGLSDRLDVGSGMLFSWPDDAPRSFWMKDTRVPLSVAFIDANGLVLQIEQMAPESEEYTWGIGLIREALEVPRGAFQELAIGVGSRLVSRQCRSLLTRDTTTHSTNHIGKEEA